MRCPQCQTENRNGARFCVNCGAGLVLACSQCGAELPAAAKFCDACGAQVVALPADVREEPADAVSERLQRLVPKEYAERLLATRGQVPAERRMVTILFSDVKGSTAMAEHLDPEDVMEIMDGAFDVLIAPIYRYEGTLARLMGDAILAFFGAPIAHEDDPERACRAALEIVAGAERYAARLEEERGVTGFNVRVGIHTGLVVVGEVGSDLRVEYTAMGDAINLAARMEQNAPPGGILITHDTYRHVRGVFSVLQQEPLRVKGKEEPVQTYLVQQAKPRAFRKGVRGVEGIETRMIGREGELRQLQDAFHTAMEDRELQMVTIVGEAGVGKTRLLYEFDIWSEVLPEQFYYFKGRASQQMHNIPYSLIRDLIAFRFQVQDTDAPTVVREKLERGMGAALGAGEGSCDGAHYVGHLMGFELGAIPHLATVADDGRLIRERALAHLVDYFKALATQLPVLILLEDLHWTDDSSLDVLNELGLALTDQPLMIVSTARPELYERRPYWGEGQPFHTRMPLRPLSKRNTRRLLDEILTLMETVPESLRDLVVHNAEGNPFFVEELIKMLIEDGLIVKSEDQWRLDLSRLAQVRVPSTLTGVLQARLDRLPVEERTIVQQASVVGRLFWDRAVMHINESSGEKLDQSQVQSTLSALRGREMIFRRETTAFAGSQEYIFKNALLREATYESVLKRVRSVYHSLVADWLLEEGGERAAEYTALIADHLELAGRSDEAIEYLLAAGDRARGLYAHQEAIGAYQRALALMDEEADHEPAARTLMKLGQTHHTAFDFRSAQQAYDEAFALWQESTQAQPESPPPAPHALRVTARVPRVLDPGIANDSSSLGTIEVLFGGLVGLTPDGDVVPDVALSWEVSEGGRKYVFKLRTDVQWTDGTRVTAHDFEYAWKRVLAPATASKNASLLFDLRGARAFHQGLVPDGQTVGVCALDDHTLEVELEGPTGYFLHLLTYPGLHPVPRHVVEAHGAAWTDVEHLVSNGPFFLRSFERDTSAVLVRNRQYHGQFTGNVEEVELTFIPSGPCPAAVAAYEADLLDTCLLEAAPLDEMERVRQAHAAEYVSLPQSGTFFLSFDGTRAPFDDPRVRQAFAHALDRALLVPPEPAGCYFPASGGFLPPGLPGHTAGIALEHNPLRAQELLAEAGYPEGRGLPEVNLLVWPRAEHVAVGAQVQWRDTLGVQVQVEVMEWPELLRRIWEERPLIHAMGWAADYPDPDSCLRVGMGLHRLVDKSVYDELVERARRLTDQAERLRLYRQADRILMEEAAIVPITYERDPLLVKPWVRRFLDWRHTIIDAH